MSTLAWAVWLIAFTQGATIGFIWRRTRSRPLMYVYKGKMTSVTLSRTIDQSGKVVVEFSDDSAGWFTRINPRSKK